MLYYNPLSISSTNYPYCFRHEVFNATELKKIIKYCNTLEKTKAKVLEKTKDVNNDKIRVSDIGWITLNTESKWIFDRLAQSIDSLNNEYYQYNLFGFNAIQYAEYNSKQLGKYDYHMDMALNPTLSQDNMTRKLSVSLLLDNTFEGGEFEFNLSHPSTSVPELIAGSIIVFPAYLLHRVKPVTKGIRRSLTVWCVGPKFK